MQSVLAVMATMLGALTVPVSSSAPAQSRSADTAADRKAALRELVAQADPDKAQKLAEAFVAACGDDANTVRQAIREDRDYAEVKPGWFTKELSFVVGTSRPKAATNVRVPKGYTAARAWPVLICAHGTHGSGMGAGKMMETLLGADVEDYILVCPQLVDADGAAARGYAGTIEQERMQLDPLDFVRRTMNVDDDRVCMTGYSQGGHASWHLAATYPRLFAAVVPMAGVPHFEGNPYTFLSYMCNIRNLPVWSIWGELDRPSDPQAIGNADYNRMAAARLAELKCELFKGTELKGAGHGGCFPPQGEFAKYVSSARRTVVPETIVHQFHLAHHGRAYYLEATELAQKPIDFSQGGKVTLSGPISPGATPEEKIKAVTGELDKRIYRLEGGLDRRANKLTICGTRITSVRVYVMEGMFDLAKPVTIEAWGSTWRGMISLSPECMARHYAEARDGSALVANEITVTSAGLVRVRHLPRGGA